MFGFILMCPQVRCSVTLFLSGILLHIYIRHAVQMLCMKFIVAQYVSYVFLLYATAISVSLTAVPFPTHCCKSQHCFWQISKVGQNNIPFGHVWP